jgi:hypothetical protein
MNSSMFKVFSLEPVRKYFCVLGDSVSQLLNAFLFNSGNANESVSARCWRQRDHWFFGRLRVIVDKVFSWFGGENHCRNSYRAEIALAILRSRAHKFGDS